MSTNTKACERCGGALRRRQARFCSNVCKDTAHRTNMGKACSECSRPARSRGLCDAHYAAWWYRNAPGAKEIISRRNRARYAARPWSQWSEVEKQKYRDAERVNQRRYRATLADSYVRATYNVPGHAAPSVLDTFRAYLLLWRKVKGSNHANH